MLHRPAVVSNIVVRLPCRSLVFLHGAVEEETEGAVIGRFLLHYLDGTTELIPLAYGRQSAHWETDPATIPSLIREATHTTAHQLSGTNAVWLYATRWINPHPDRPVSHIDFLSTMTQSAPFLIALTAERSEKEPGPEGSEESAKPKLELSP
jgi:hypothetical protein